MNIIFPIPIPSDSEPYVAPKCPHCHAELPGWEPPTENSIYDNPFFIIGSILAVLFFLAFWVITLMNWIDGSNTLTQVLRDEWNWLLALVHRIW